MVVKLLKRSEESLDTSQVLSVVEKYSRALELLDDYDHQALKRPEGTRPVYDLSYQESRGLIDSMSFMEKTDLFGRERDESFRASIGDIYQSFDGHDIYPSVQEKAANLLYFITKNHSFLDGNKRIAAAVFLYFLDIDGWCRINHCSVTAANIEKAQLTFHPAGIIAVEFIKFSLDSHYHGCTIKSSEIKR